MVAKCLYPEAQPPYVFAINTSLLVSFPSLIRSQTLIFSPALALASQSSPPPSSALPQTPRPSPRHPSCPLSAVTSVHQSMIAAANQNAVHRSNGPMRGQRCGPLVADSSHGQQHQQPAGEEEAAAFLSCLYLTTSYRTAPKKTLTKGTPFGR